VRHCPAAEYARAEKAEATRRAYRSDFELFRAWCAERRVSVLPASPESVAAFLAHEAERQVRPSTIGRRVAAIRYAHKLAGLPLPTDDERVRATVRGIRRSLGAAPCKKAPATAERVIGMAPLAGTRLSAIRDRALAAAVRLCRRLPSLRARRAQCRGPRGNGRGPSHHHPPQQDGPGGARPRHRHSARDDRLPCGCREGVA
jgi:hypothetical protein